MINRWRKFMIGTGKGRAGFVGLLDTSSTSGAGVSNSGTVETVLFSAKVPANSLYKNGMGLAIKAFGTYAANANNKRLRVYLNTTAVAGGMTVFDSANQTFNNVAWWLEVLLYRSASKVQIAVGKLNADAITAAIVKAAANGSQDDTVDQFIVLTAISDTAGNDITAKALTVMPHTL